MSERRAVTFAMVAGLLITAASGAGVVLLGGGGELLVATTFVVAGLAVDQISKLIMSFEPPKRR